MAFGKNKEKQPKAQKAETKKGNPNEKSELAVRYNIRVSKPYGYYPEDVDKILEDLERQLNNLQTENSKLTETAETAVRDKKRAETELQKLLLSVQTMEYPDTSTEQDKAMIERLQTITGRVTPSETVMPEIVGVDAMGTAKHQVSAAESGVVDISNMINTVPKRQIPQPEYQKSMVQQQQPVQSQPEPAVQPTKKVSAVSEDGFLDILQL
mgnify:CR=1 FL=1